MAHHTPGPWEATKRRDYREIIGPRDRSDWYGRKGVWAVAYVDTDLDEAVQDGNARLIAAAPDHAMIGWAMCVAAGRWEPWGDGRGEFCINGFRHATKLDEFGVPEMTGAMRAAIARAKGGPS